MRRRYTCLAGDETEVQGSTAQRQRGLSMSTSISELLDGAQALLGAWSKRTNSTERMGGCRCWMRGAQSGVEAKAGRAARGCDSGVGRRSEAWDKAGGQWM